MPQDQAWQVASERRAAAGLPALFVDLERPTEPGRGRLSLVEICGAAPNLTAAQQSAIAGADLIVYECSLAPLIAVLLPTGLYAEPATPGMPGSPVVERALRFALDGWNVAQLVGTRSGSVRSLWVRQAVEQIAAAGAAADIPVLVVVDDESADGAPGGMPRIETRLGAAHGVVADRGLSGCLTTVFGPLASGPAPQVYAFGANGLAG
jgi:hypothetical protein